jgi:peroxiredoxin
MSSAPERDASSASPVASSDAADSVRKSPLPPSASPPGRTRYGWLVGILGLILVAYISLNTLRTEGPGSTGPQVGQQLPPFAAPLVSSDLEGDANVATRRDQGDAGSVPACDVTDPRALNVCAIVRQRPLVLAFLTAGAEKCARELDAMQSIAADFPQVAFAAVGIKGKRDEFRQLARSHSWTFPLAQDRDGAVANLYGIAVCPTVVLAARGGSVKETLLGDEASTPRALAAHMRTLERG